MGQDPRPQPQQQQQQQQQPDGPASFREVLVDFSDLDMAGNETSSTATPSDTSASSASSRPEHQRRSTEPPPSDASSLSTYMRERPRNRSPYGYSRNHLRSQSHASALAPPMTRTRSLPLVSTAASGFSFASGGRSPLRPSSPNTRNSGRQSPRRSFDELPTTPLPSFMDIESIAEDSELDLSMRSSSTITPPTLHSASFSRSNSGRRRPSSPLHYQLAPPPLVRAASPTLGNIKFNEPFPTQSQPHQSSASLSTLNSASSMSTYGPRDSMPSTPTSLRSRSPSVSSLETIPDSPDAEEAAVEAYNLAQLKAAADAAEAEAEAEKNGGSTVDKARSKNRKRWSVCGAERRTDFEMETIWED